MPRVCKPWFPNHGSRVPSALPEVKKFMRLCLAWPASKLLKLDQNWLKLTKADQNWPNSSEDWPSSPWGGKIDRNWLKIALNIRPRKGHININSLVQLPLGRPLVCPRDNASLSLGQTRVVPGTNPGFLLFTQQKPGLSQGQTQFVPGRNRGRREAEKVNVPSPWKVMQSTVNSTGNIEDVQLQFSALRQLLYLCSCTCTIFSGTPSNMHLQLSRLLELFILCRQGCKWGFKRGY